MSRSYKKTLIVKDKDRWYQKYSNRLVRHQKIDFEDVAPRQKRIYRKLTPVYNISDWTQLYDPQYDHIVDKSWYYRK